jgi:hypothetical protein
MRPELVTVSLVWRTTSSSMLYVTTQVPVLALSVPYAATYVPARLQIPSCQEAWKPYLGTKKKRTSGSQDRLRCR